MPGHSDNNNFLFVVLIIMPKTKHAFLVWILGLEE
jgi:hypothetical protein